MRKVFQTVRDYHQAASGIRVEHFDWPGVSVNLLHEASNDVHFQKTSRNGLVMTLDGSAAHLTRMDGIADETPSAPEEICLIPHGLEVHLAWRNHEAVQASVMIEFDDSLFQTYAPEILTSRFTGGHLVPANFARRPVLGHLTRVMAAEIDPTRHRGRLFAETAIRLLALEIAATAWSSPLARDPLRMTQDRRIAIAIDFIETHYAHDISLIEIAGVANLSPAQLTTLFRQTTGLAPYQYVIDRRLRQAIHLLRQTDLPIAIVALDAGFSDQAHLTRLMRSRLNTTPRAVRIS